MEDVASGYQVVAIKVRGRDHIPIEDVIFDVGGIAEKAGHHRVGPLVLLLGPARSCKFEGELLHAQSQGVPAFRSEGRVGGRLDHSLDHVVVGEHAVPLRFPSLLEVRHGSAQHLVPSVLRALLCIRETEVPGQLIDPRDILHEGWVQVLRINKLQKRTLRIRI